MSVRLNIYEMKNLVQELMWGLEFYEEVMEGVGKCKNNPSTIEAILNMDYDEWKKEKGYAN